MKETRTKGNVIVEQIEVGDILYEFEYGTGVEVEVLTKPELNDEGNYVWKAKNTKNGEEIRYLVNPKYPHYAPNLYDYKAYRVNHWI